MSFEFFRGEVGGVGCRRSRSSARMTTRKAKATATATEEADPSAALRDDNSKNDAG
jgi:hypothetical protein